MLERGSRLADRAEWAGVTRLANVTGLDVIAIPVISAVRPRSRSVTVSHGKGLTLEVATISAVHEACELRAAEDWQGEIVWATHCDLDNGTTYPLERMPRFAGGQNIDHLSQTPLPWVRGTRLGDGATIWLPLELVGFNQEVPPRRGFGIFAGSATGLGASEAADAATLHALCEVIERSCFAEWRQRSSASRAATRLRLDSVADPALAELFARIRKYGLTLLVFDMTNHLAVPCYLAELFDFTTTGFRVPYSQGLAASPERLVALRQAVLEAAQARLSFISGARDDLDWHDYGPGTELQRQSRQDFAAQNTPSLEFPMHLSAGPHTLASLRPLLKRELADAVAFVWAGQVPDDLSIVKIIDLDLEDGLDPALDIHLDLNEPADARSW